MSQTARSAYLTVLSGDFASRLVDVSNVEGRRLYLTLPVRLELHAAISLGDISGTYYGEIDDVASVEPGLYRHLVHMKHSLTDMGRVAHLTDMDRFARRTDMDRMVHRKNVGLGLDSSAA